MRLLFISLALLLGLPASAAILGEEIRYEINGESFVGYLSYDTAQRSPRPAVLIVHEWWGHNAYARQRADMLAAEGYVALALDMYGGGRHSSEPGQAQMMMQQAMGTPGAIAARFDAARALLAGHPATDPDRIAALGYCFGGGVVLNMARMGSALRGVISFHGSLKSAVPAGPGAHHPPVLVFNGEADPFVPAAQVAAFRQEMQQAGISLRYVGYADALHGFTNPGADELGARHGLPLKYDRAADTDSWEQSLDFLARIFWR